MAFPALEHRDPTSRYEGLSEAANIADVTGNAGMAARSRAQLDKFLGKHTDFDPSSVAVDTFRTADGGVDYSRLASGADQGIGALVRMRKQKLRKGGGSEDIGRALNHYKIGLQGDIERSSKEALLGEINPSLDAAQSAADARLGESAINAGEEQAMRSRISAMVRSAESQRMARIGAGLGYGNMANSPAAAALAADAANDADTSIVSSLRDLGLQVSEVNRAQAAKDIELATRTAAAKFSLNNGESKSIIAMRGEVQQMLDALYSRDQTMDLMKKQLEESGQQSTADRIGQWAGIGSSLAQTAGSVAAL